MRTIKPLLFVFFLSLVGCQDAMHGTGEDIAKVTLGMTKPQVINVLGKPSSVGGDDSVEKLYYRKMGHVTDWEPTSYEVVFKDGKVIRYGEAH